MTRKLTTLTILLFSFLTVFSQTENDNYRKMLPQRIGWINDFENIFTEEQEKSLDSLVAAYEKRTSTEIAIISIPTNVTDKEKFDDFVLQIANDWGVGKKEKNNGILIGISKGLRKIRISNGLGIEKLLTDYQTKQIIDTVLIPNFKKDNFYQGTFQGIQEIIKVLDQGPKSDFINLNELKVYQYIELLKIDNNNTNKFNVLTIGTQTSENWLTEKDIDTLITLINSTEPAKCVMQVISSHFPVGDSSTIGGQVMDIIEAYKDKKLYPTILTSCAKTDEKRIEQLKQWWDEHKK